MSQSSWFQQTPRWVWLSAIPVFGGLAISYAGYKSKTKGWIAVGIGITGASLLLSSSGLTSFIWMGQIGLSVYLKKRFLAKTYPKTLPIPHEPELAKIIANNRDKIDINECTKNDLVMLGIPIVYANNVESLQNEGYIFTHIEELSEIAGIPEKTVAKVSSMLVFSYNYRKEADSSWRRLNTYTVQELIDCGLDAVIAEKIVRERQRKGEYKSLIDVKYRTNLPVNSYKQIS
ncbi:helix-hairpin-helix domain-containing protein [Calothrix sp. PCC 6303]|uniref:helix-hairpin-helix domain-containing protein n=1 Tax=Calothrix sp. PCC 6303 TaxID=1170562 RepID=UPI0002A05158|nr:helix-hairpin-helix domain-containing protein [Calothrix sp. PCC 6303]AFZ02157.1 hypothetical protein Cal6303_3216 [Calothrix sp. PCC 6303]